MSTPERHDPPAPLVPTSRAVSAGEPVIPTRTARAVAWVGWHLGELAGVIVPAVLAATVVAWFALLSSLVALEWAVREYRTRKTTNRTDEQGEQG